MIFALGEDTRLIRMIKNKRGFGGLIWFLIILILILIGIVVYIQVSGDGSVIGGLGGSSVPPSG